MQNAERKRPMTERAAPPGVKTDRAARATADGGPGGARVAVSRAVYNGIEAVRGSGLTTMLNRALVSDLACLYGYKEAAMWVRSHWREYAKGLCLGFDPTD
jgi:hypothetical protein